MIRCLVEKMATSPRHETAWTMVRLALLRVMQRFTGQGNGRVGDGKFPEIKKGPTKVAL